MGDRMRTSRTTLKAYVIAVTAGFFLVSCASGGEEQGTNIYTLVKSANETNKPQVLQTCLQKLIRRSDEKALKHVQALLTREDRLLLLYPHESLARLRVDDSRLFGVLRFAAENLSGKSASGMLVSLSRAAPFRPQLLRNKLGSWTSWSKEQSQRVFIREKRRDAVLIAAGYVKEPSEELVAVLLQCIRNRAGSNEAICSLARIGNPACVSALAEVLESKHYKHHRLSRLTDITTIAQFRDRPEVFRLLVNHYIESGEENAPWILIPIVEDEIGDKGPVTDVSKPYYSFPRYETIPAPDARFYVEQFDRLLNQDHRPLSAEERGKLEGIRNMLARKAAEDEKQQNKQKNTSELEGADAD